MTNPGRSLSKPVDSVILGRRRYPLMLDTLSEVMKVFSIPLPFVNMLAAHTTIAMDFDTVQDFQSLLTTDFKCTDIICVLGPIALATSVTGWYAAGLIGLNQGLTKAREEVVGTMNTVRCNH
jgi:hypothetical protein